MSSILEELAPELLFSIFEFIEEEESLPNDKSTTTRSAYSDLLNLSSTSHTFRNILSPRIFRHVNLSNDDESAGFCSGIANGPYAKYVKELHLTAVTAIPDGYNNPDDDPKIKDVEGCLPVQSIDILSNLHRFPNLEKLRVQFPFPDDNWWGLSQEGQWENQEHEKEMLEAETTFAWRALLAKTFSSIVQNRPGLIKKFEYLEAPIKPCSPWYHENFKVFLSNLEEFKISLCGGDNGAGWQINTTEAYPAFFAQLQSSFLSHLTNVTCLYIAATESGPIGGQGYYQALTPFRVANCPNLQKLNLEQVFIDQPLLDFILARQNTLEAIDMHNCHACDDEGNMAWHELFNRVADAAPGHLKSWKIFPVDMDLDSSGSDTSQETVYAVKSTLSRNPGKRIFSYAIIDDKYGFVFTDATTMVESFYAGNDQKSWDRLQNIMAENSRKGTRT